jgi:hypothetical protein
VTRSPFPRRLGHSEVVALVIWRRIGEDLDIARGSGGLVVLRHKKANTSIDLLELSLKCGPPLRHVVESAEGLAVLGRSIGDRLVHHFKYFADARHVCPVPSARLGVVVRLSRKTYAFIASCPFARACRPCTLGPSSRSFMNATGFAELEIRSTYAYHISLRHRSRARTKESHHAVLHALLQSIHHRLCLVRRSVLSDAADTSPAFGLGVALALTF